MSFPRIGGLGIPLTMNQTPQQPSNAISLAAGELYYFPAGTWWVNRGPYSFVQYLDPLTNSWKIHPCDPGYSVLIDADDGNMRLANISGTPVGALITSATTSGGGGYTNGIGTTATGCIVTPSAGSSKWTPVVGGAISTTLTSGSTTNSGTVGVGYNFPPICIISPPPTGGLQATAVTTLTGGTISVSGTNITITNQGAGYLTTPTMTFIPDPREVSATAPGPTTTAKVVLTLTGTGALTGLYPSDHGSALTTVPTLTFAGGLASAGNASATAIMNFTVTGLSVSGGFGGYTSTGTVTQVVTIGNLVSTAVANAFTNPAHATGVTFPRPARLLATLSTGAITSAGITIEDGGLGIQAVPTATVVGWSGVSSGGNSASNPGGLTVVVGGTTDTSWLQPF